MLLGLVLCMLLGFALSNLEVGMDGEAHAAPRSLHRFSYVQHPHITGQHYEVLMFAGFAGLEIEDGVWAVSGSLVPLAVDVLS